MANQVASLPWVIDTASATAICSHDVKIANIEFTGYALDADAFEIKDINGRSVWKGNGKSDLSPIRSGGLGWVQGLAVTTLTAPGVLYIYLE